MPVEKTVRELMHPIDVYPAIQEDAPVEQALDLICEEINRGKPPCMIVVGKGHAGGRVVKGFVTAPEVLFGLTDHFLKGTRHVGPIFWEGQLRDECLCATRKPVSEIMSPVCSCINGTEKVMEAIFLLNKCRSGFLPVVQCGEVIGLLHIEDLLREVARCVS